METSEVVNDSLLFNFELVNIFLGLNFGYVGSDLIQTRLVSRLHKDLVLIVDDRIMLKIVFSLQNAVVLPLRLPLFRAFDHFFGRCVHAHWVCELL